MGYNGSVKFLGLRLNKKQKRWLEFLWTLTEKDIKVRYKFTVLGFLWMIVKPLLQMLMMGFVFQFFVPVKTDNYFIFLFTGLLPWNFFSTTVVRNVSSIVNERFLIRKAQFPRETIVLSIVLSNFFHLFVSLVLFMLILLVFGLMSWKWPLLLFCLVVLLCLVSGLSLLLSALNVKFRDSNFIVPLAMQLWFYATPVIYTLDLLPRNLSFLFYFNPMTSMVEIFRFLLIGVLPVSPNLLFVGLLLTVLIFVFGVLMFKKESPFFDDWL